MLCNHCGVDIQYNTSRCPICGAQVDGSCLPDLFPKPPKLTNKKNITFSNIFFGFITYLCLSFLLILINIFTFKELAWSLIATSLIFLLFLALFYTFNNKYSLACRNFFTFSACIIACYLIGYLLDLLYYINFCVIPNLFALFTLTNFASLILFDKAKYLFSTLFFSLLNITPLVLYACGIKVSLTISIVGIVLAFILSIISLIINRKNLKHLFSSFFHF